MKKSKRNNNIPTKKYVFTFLGIIGIFLLITWCFKWHQVKENEKYLKSYLVSSGAINLEMNDLNEIESVLSETSNDYYVYVSYTENEDIYNYEKELKPIIDEYNIKSDFYFLNIINIKKDNKNYKEELAKKLAIDKKNLNEIPVILHFDDGKLEHTIHTANELKDLLKAK